MERAPLNEDDDTGSQPKRRRLNRPVTACSTCRRLKTRCEIASKDACRRCISLGMKCDIPSVELETLQPEAAVPVNIEERLGSIERNLETLSSLLLNYGATSRQGDIRERPKAAAGPSPTWSADSAPPRTMQEHGVMRPVLLLRNLQVRLFGPKRDFGDEVLAIGNVVSAGIIGHSIAKYLLKLFIQRLGEWISVFSEDDLPPDVSDCHPLLFSTACLLAAPHVPNLSKEAIQKMYLLVRQLTASTILKSPPLSYESLQALLLLSVFSPTIQTAMPMDSWMLSGVGVNHAVLSFNLANQAPAAEAGEETGLRRLRIWNAFCLTNIQFSIGNARPSIVSQRFVDYCSQILDFSASNMRDAALFAEVVLYNKTETLLNHFPSAPNDGLPVYEELEKWHMFWKHIRESPANTTLDFSYDFSHLLLQRTALKAHSHSVDLQHAVTQTARKLLERFLDLDFSSALTMPDFFFFIIIYAALTLCRFALGHEMILVASVQEYLIAIAPNDEHIAYRFGTILKEMRRAAVEAGISISSNTEDEQAFVAAQFPATSDSYTWQMLTTGTLNNLNFPDGELSFSMPDEPYHPEA